MKVTDKFVQADSRNLPKVDYFMLLQYMAEREEHNVAAIRGAKTLLSSRASYVDAAVGYVEVNRTGNNCIINAKVTPEHRVKAKLYSVSATIDENEEKILLIECNDCAASQAGCKHSICFAMWLIKRTEEPATTSITCYWKKPQLSDSVTAGKFVAAKNLGKKRKCFDMQLSSIPDLKHFLDNCKKNQMSDCLLLNYNNIKKQKLMEYNVFNLILKYKMENTDDSFLKVKQYLENIICDDIRKQIEKETRGQVNNTNWHNLRQFRITASKIYEVSKCKTENGALVKTIIGGYKVPETKAIKRGRVLEKKVIKQLEDELNEKIADCGLFLINPFIGGSPDGICKDFVVEVKCPSKENTIKNYIKNGAVTNKYKGQIMLQMLAANKQKSLFCVADPNFEENKVIYKYWVDFDQTFAENLIKSGEEFWQRNIFPEVLECVKF